MFFLWTQQYDNTHNIIITLFGIYVHDLEHKKYIQFSHTILFIKPLQIRQYLRIKYSII